MSFEREQQLADLERRDPNDPAVRIAASNAARRAAWAKLPEVDHNGHPVNRDDLPSVATWARGTAERQHADGVAERAIETLTPQLGAEHAAKVVADAREAGGSDAIVEAMASVAEQVAAERS